MAGRLDAEVRNRLSYPEGNHQPAKDLVKCVYPGSCPGYCFAETSGPPRQRRGDFISHPVDGGRGFVDGQPLFGPSKTTRGIVLSVLVTSACAPLLGVQWKIRLS